MDKSDLLSLGVLKRTQTGDLPEFVFVERDGLFVPYRSSDTAELIGNEIYALRSDLQQDEDGELTWQDLVGYTIIEEEDGTLGLIDYIDESTINTLATLEDGRMLPLHEDFITDIDQAARILRVHLPFKL